MTRKYTISGMKKDDLIDYIITIVEQNYPNTTVIEFNPGPKGFVAFVRDADKFSPEARANTLNWREISANRKDGEFNPRTDNLSDLDDSKVMNMMKTLADSRIKVATQIGNMLNNPRAAK